MEAEAELEDAVPNISMKYDEDKTSDEYAIKAVECALKCAKPSFANHKMFVNELEKTMCSQAVIMALHLAEVHIRYVV